MKNYSLFRIFRICCLRIATYVPMNGRVRPRFVKMGGVKVANCKAAYIGEGVIFDSWFPENITIGEHVHITMGCIILTHSLDTSKSGVRWKQHTVSFGDGCFIGANTIICSNISIGKNAIVGAGSVVTKSIPDNEIWGGNPAKFIKKRME